MAEVMGRQIDLDVEDLAEQVGLRRIKPMPDWVMAACPFHNDGKERHQSFGISRDSGSYNCFTCHASGSLMDLVSDLLGLGRVEALRWLLERYGVQEIEDRKPLQLDFGENQKEEFLPEEALDPYRFRHPYVYRRKLTEDVASYFDLGYNQNTRSITIPWRDGLGRLVFIKERPISRNGPKFLNTTGAKKTRYVFGLWVAREVRAREVDLVESEICCMWLWQNKRPAIALGGSWLHREQMRQILRTPSIERVNLFLDQDEAGRDGSERAKEVLRGKVMLYQVQYPRADAKDPNELTADEVASLVSVPVL